jgi:uncharacterized protein (DUF924 family)
MQDTKENILNFWFEDTSPQQWFQVNEEFDQIIYDRYFDIYERAKTGSLKDWEVDAEGCLALCLILDQFPRNMFRGKPDAFETDKAALLISKQALHKGLDQVLSPVKRRFLYLPFEHSENMQDQKKSCELFKSMQADDPLGYEYALRHMHVIEKFGRFPHRNKILGRENTPEEAEYLKEPGAGF